jgi:hypothetical protein
MNGVMDLILAIDDGKIEKRPELKVEIKRLSELAGEPVIFTLQGVSSKEHSEIEEKATKKDQLDSDLLQVLVTLYGTKEPSLRSKELKEKLHVPTYRDVVRKLLNPGEILKIYNIVSDLSGFGEKSVEEIKNE